MIMAIKVINPMVGEASRGGIRAVTCLTLRYRQAAALATLYDIAQHPASLRSRPTAGCAVGGAPAPIQPLRYTLPINSFIHQGPFSARFCAYDDPPRLGPDNPTGSSGGAVDLRLHSRLLKAHA